MQRAMEAGHPWRVRNIEAADIVVLAANFSLLCPPTGRTYVYTLFDVWDHLLKHAPPLLLQAINGSVARPRVSIYLESSTCPNPWKYASRRDAPARLMRMRDLTGSVDDVVAPHVFTGRPWLAPDAGPTAAITEADWRSRPLLFFAGHMPKLHVSPLRYRIWRQLRTHTGVTALSNTVNCTLGSYEICSQPDRMRDGRSYVSYCHEACKDHLPTFGKGKEKRLKKCSQNEGDLHSLCRLGKYGALDWAAERKAINAASVRLSAREYAEHSMRHRFCLTAPGDTVATPKVVEFVLTATRGGCIPVLVIPDCVNCRRARRAGRKPSEAETRWRALPEAVRGTERDAFNSARLASLETHAAQLLPFSRWALDFCAMAYIVPESRTRNMSAVIGMLERVTLAEAEQKREQCVKAAPTLRYRADDRDPQRAGAITHLLAELCQVAKGAALPPPEMDARCLLLPR